MIYAKRQKRATLFEIAINFLLENFDDVESLGGIDSSIRAAITRKLVATGRWLQAKMNGQSFIRWPKLRSKA
jgi:hypothetical protein